MKRVLAMILLAAMLLGMLPAQAFATEASEAAQITESTQETDSAQETGSVQATIPTLPADAFFAPISTQIPESTQATESMQVSPLAATDSFTLYYQSANGYIFPMTYVNRMSVEQGAYFNVTDMDDNVTSYTYKVTQGDAEVDAYGMVTVSATALVDSTVTVKITDASGNTVATRSFKVTAPGMGTFAGGYGTQERPYMIATAAQFHAIKNHVSSYFMLIGDINVGSMNPFENFSGVLDGNGYTLSVWSYNQSASGYAGMIRKNSGTIKNLTMSGCTLGSVDGAEGDLVAGILCGENSGTIENVVIRSCSLAADMGAKSSGATNRVFTGFLCGVNVGVIRKCGARENTMSCYAGSGKDGGSAVCVMGGLIGELQSVGTAVENCYSYGNTMSGEAKGDNWTTGALWWKENHGSSTYFCTGGLIGQITSSADVYMVSSIGYGNSMSGNAYEGLTNQNYFGAFVGSVKTTTSKFQSCYSVNETLIGNSTSTFSGLSNASSANISALSGFLTSVWVNESSGRPVIAQNTGLTIDTGNAKTEYLVGESLNYNGLMIYAQNSAGAKTLVERGYRISGYERNYAEGTQKQTVTVTYGKCSGTFDCYPRAFHNLCILYKDEAGNIVGREYKQVAEGDSYTLPVSLPGYVPRETSVSGTMGTEDMTVSVTCDPKEYDVVIHYLYSDDTKAAQDYKTTVTYGQVLSVDSPTVIGYSPNPETVTIDTTHENNILKDKLEASVYYVQMNEKAYTVVTMLGSSGLAGVSVSFNGQTKQTDSNGQATFTYPYSDQTATLQIQKEGYVNTLYKEEKEYKLKAELGIDYFTMKVDSANNPHYSVSGISCYGNDIEKDYGVINVKYEDIIPIVVKGNVPEGDRITKMLLVQEVETTKVSDDDQTVGGISGATVRKILQTLLSSDASLESDGTCEFQVKGTCFSHNILMEYPIMVYMYTELSAEPVVQKLNIGTVQLSTELKFDGLFDGVEMSLEDTGIDFLNGTKLSFGLEDKFKTNFPLSAEIKNNEVYIAYNMSDDFNYQMKLMDKNGIINKANDAKTRADSYMKYMAQKLDDRFANNKLFNTTTTTSFEIDSEFAGGLCFTVYPNEKIAVKTYLKLTLSMNAGWTTDFMILYIPLTVEVTSSLEGELTITGMGFDFDKQEIVWPSTSVGLNWKLGLSAGLGNRYASAGAFGRISIGTTLVLGEETYFDALILNGEAGFYAKLSLGLLKLYGEKSWKFLDKTVHLVPQNRILRLTDPALVDDPGYVGEYEGLPVYDVSSYTLMTAEEEAPSWTVPDADELDSDGIDTASARILTVGEDVLAVYFGEDTKRDIANAKTLMYRVYDGATKTWSQERQVDSNGTGDTAFDMILYKGTVYLAYAQANQEFSAADYGEDTTALINDMAFSQEIAVMRFDASVGKFTAVTDAIFPADNCYDSLPTLGVVNGKLYLSWNKNTAKDNTAVFCMNTENYIWSCSFDGNSWTTPACLVYNCYPVADMKLLEVSGTPQVALIVDEDASLYTEDDRNLYFADMNGSITYVNCYGESISSLQSAQVRGVSTLLWRSGTRVKALQDLNVGPYQFSQNGQFVAEDFRFVNISESLHALVWSDKDIDTNGTITSDLIVAYQWDSNDWTQPAVLKTVPYHLMAYDLCADESGIHIVFTDTYMVTPEETGEMTLTSYSKLLYSLRKLPTILTVDNATVDVQEDVQKVRVDVTLTNNGACTVNAVGITLTDIIKEPVVSSGGGGGTIISVASVDVLTDTQTKAYSETKTYKVTRNDYDLGDFTIDLLPGQTITVTAELALTETMKFEEFDFTFDVVTEGSSEEEESGGVTVGGNVILAPPGRPGVGGEYTSELVYPDVLVEGEYIIIDDAEYISLRVENKGETSAYGYLRLFRLDGDNQTRVYSVYISGLLPDNVKYYLVKLEKDFFEATMEEFLCTVSVDGDSDTTNNEVTVFAKKLEGEQGAQKDILVEAPVLSDYIQTFDKYAPGDLQLDIFMSEDILSFYGCVDAQKAPVDPDYVELEAGKQLRATFRQSVLSRMENGTYEYTFLFQTVAGYIDAVYTLHIVDNTPIPIRGNVYITDSTGNAITDCQRGTVLSVNIADVNTDQLEFAWIVDGQVVSEEWKYTVGEEHLGSDIHVQLSGVAPYCGTLKTQSVTMDKVARSLTAPVVLSSSSGTAVALQKTFHVGNDAVSYGYARTKDASAVLTWTEDTRLTLPEEGIYYLFAKAPGTAVYQGVVSAATVYSTTGEVTCHNYVDGYCTICGEAAPGNETLFNLAGANLELSNDITMYFYVYAEDITDGCYMEIIKSYADGTKVTRKVEMADWRALGNMYYVGFNGMAAKEMADDIAVTVYNAEGVQVSNTTVASVSTYALKALNSASYADLHTLMADLLNYGTAAQYFFNYNTEKLANAEMTDAHRACATQNFDMDGYTNDVVIGTGAVGANLGLETNIVQYFYFDSAIVDSTMTAKVSYTNYKGVEKITEISGDRFGTLAGYGYVIVDVAVLVPADVMCMVSVDIVDAGGNVVASVGDSISSYAVRAYGNAQTETDKALYVELMEYALSCESYFS